VQTLIRYSVVNQDGRAVIRAVPVSRRASERTVSRHEIAVEPREHSLRRMFRRLLPAR
jgi:hypothetical protein